MEVNQYVLLSFFVCAYLGVWVSRLCTPCAGCGGIGVPACLHRCVCMLMCMFIHTFMCMCMFVYICILHVDVCILHVDVCVLHVDVCILHVDVCVLHVDVCILHVDVCILHVDVCIFPYASLSCIPFRLVSITWVC